MFRVFIFRHEASLNRGVGARALTCSSLPVGVSCAGAAMSQFIEAILFAEFDIDKGSVLRQQYPRKVTDDEGLMAELMIPEGIHNHFQDWTVFMLNRPTQPPKQAAAPRKC